MSWLSRMRLQNPGIGRLAYVHPASGELFYLRILLSHRCGCRSFTDIRTVGNVVHDTYRSACDSLGLLGDDREWLSAFVESSSWATSSELRVLFVHLLLFCEVSQPLLFWDTQWKGMGDDIRLRLTSQVSSLNCFINDDEPSMGKIVLAVAASGIASLLLPAGRTAHSRFKIPINLTDESMCHAKKGTHLAELLMQTVLIIWDEAPMSDRRCFECLDRTLRDITDNSS
ncbi:hypothetical protein CASFOL_028569 [Castilleja foliolosa]|uniref:ATP-dependent DNA helicase n=1 Tax=Castilleja foliolosa TaxID=1961234 RepID=A0ABD3CDS9_9LAMI